jgi:hypothetical protein
VTTDLLETRLRDLIVETPDAGRMTARVISEPGRRVLFVPRLALSAVMAAGLIALSLYFVPSSSAVIAKVPFAGPAFGASEHVTSVGSSATSAGYTLTLTGAYADTTRTELLIHSSRPIVFIGSDSTLTDQFGRSYHGMTASSNPLAGDETLEFQPLAWPDSVTGARITLSISSLETGPHPTADVVKGSWTLHATLGVDEGHAIALPAPGTLGPARFQFTSVIYTPATIAIELDMTGASDQELTTPVFNGDVKPVPALSLDVLDSAGNVVTGRIEIDDGWFGVYHVHLLAYRNDSGLGTYTIRVSRRGSSFERTIKVS